MANNRQEIEELHAIEWRLFCHTLRLKHYTYAEIDVLAREKFERPFGVKKIAALCAAELTERIEQDEHVAARLRYALSEELDGLARVLQPLLAPTHVDQHGTVWETKITDRLAAVREYRGLLQDRARLLGLNAAEKVEATITVITPQDPAVQALIAEAEALTERHNP